MILYGSAGIKENFQDFKRLPKDYDYLLDAVEYEAFKNESWYKIKNGDRYEYCRIPPIDKYVNYGNTIALHPDITYTLKISHIFWEIKWDKHIYDIQFLKSKNCKLIPELFNDLYHYWSDFHGKNRRMEFDATNEDFFKDNVKRPIAHDEIHEMIKVYSKPMFSYVKEDLNKSEICQDKFNKLCEADKFLLVQEEACVLAFERYLYTGLVTNNRAAYSRALKDLIMRLTPLWLGIFIVDNYTLLNKPHINYKEKILTHLNID